MKTETFANSGEVHNIHTGIYVLLALIVAVLVFNQLALSGIAASITGTPIAQTQGAPVTAAVVSNGGVQTFSDVIPKGIPAIYGQELGVSFDDVNANTPDKVEQTIAKLAALDQGITLQGAELQRYITIASQISCEYCCGAKSIIFENGQPACGCAHSFAMRGVGKYLIQNHGSEYTDDGILEEMGKWKTLFFPAQLTEKADALKSKGIELNYVNLASNKYRGIEKGTGGGMVGGC